MIGKAGKTEFVFDDQDAALVLPFKWHLNRPNGYVRRCCGDKKIYLHRELMKPPAGMWVDHANGNRLDNRRSNLRVCTPAQNQANRVLPKPRSGFRGVVTVGHKWRAQASKGRHLGYFDTPEDAFDAYCAYAKRTYGEFATVISA